MTKWEYYSVSIDAYDFNLLGQSGWELVSVEEGRAYFKRAIIQDEEDVMVDTFNDALERLAKRKEIEKRLLAND